MDHEAEIGQVQTAAADPAGESGTARAGASVGAACVPWEPWAAWAAWAAVRAEQRAEFNQLVKESFEVVQ